MLIRLPGAVTRAAMVVMLIALPSVFLPTGSEDGAQIVVLVAIFAGLFTMVEYCVDSPSLVEFRDAPPFNRVRFSALFATVLCLSIILRGDVIPSDVTRVFQENASYIGAIIEFRVSPVHLMVETLPADAAESDVIRLRDAAGLSYLISLLSIVWFVILLRLHQWPRRNGAFNVWINLPTFDPTAGGDVVKRLHRDGRINVILGFSLPFLIPVAMNFATALGSPLRLDDPQTVIWTVTAWAFLPASILMRGVALTRVAQMIDRQRKIAYAKATGEEMLPA